MNYAPLVSIVIPAYNASNYLSEAIDSALSQTYQNIEIIVVNDGSKDDGKTRAVAQQYLGKIRYIEKENGGSSSALNAGIKAMQGEWFSWLSHDDLYYPQKIEAQIQYMNAMDFNEEKREKCVFFACSEMIDAKGKLIRRSSDAYLSARANKINHITDNAYFVAEPTHYTFHGCSCLVNRKVFDKIGMFDEELRIVNDVDMWYRIFTEGYQICYIPEVIVKGRVHGKQVSRTIGYSYHNTEQDMYWNRSLNWLLINRPNNSELFYKFGRNAFEKTRNAEGEKAFAKVKSLNPDQRMRLFYIATMLKLKASALTFLKKIFYSLRH